MGIEVWGTYSVRDHRAPKAFVADVMLYDRLVIPVPAQGDLESWRDRDVERQRRLLEILGDRGRQVVWDAYLRQQWQSKWDAGKIAAGMTDRHAFGLTPNVLINNLPKGVMGVAAAVLFKSKEQALNAMDWKPALPGMPQGMGEVAAVIGRELLVPDDPSWDDFDSEEQSEFSDSSSVLGLLTVVPLAEPVHTHFDVRCFGRPKCLNQHAISALYSRNGPCY